MRKKAHKRNHLSIVVVDNGCVHLLKVVNLIVLIFICSYSNSSNSNKNITITVS